MRVYIAGPYTQGRVEDNVRNAVMAAEMLLNAGHHPYVPHLNHLWHLITPHTYETWLELDMVYLAQCEALVRIKGESPGADREIVFARTHNIPIFYGVENFLDFAAK